MSHKIIGKKALVVNPNTREVEAVTGGLKRDDTGCKMVLNFGAAYSITFKDQEEWDKFVLWVANLNPREKEEVVLATRPILKRKDLIRWSDGGVGLVVGAEWSEKEWVYTIVWQDTKRQSTVTDSGLRARKYGWSKIN